MNEPILSEATTQQVFDELGRRFPAVVMLYENLADADDKTQLMLRSTGGLSRCIGMMWRGIGMLEKEPEEVKDDEVTG